MTNLEYAYEIISNENDARLCAELIAQVFCEDNPIAIFDKTKPEEFFDIAWGFMNEVFDQKLSFLVRHRLSGEIVGAIVAGDLNIYHHRHPFNDSDPPCILPVSDLLEEMDNTFIERDFGQELQPNLVLQIAFVAVSGKHSGKGISSQLNLVLFNYAHNERGFKYAFVQTTNPITRHIYGKKMGGKEVTTIDPATWVWKKKNEGLLCPYKDYTVGPISNILIDLKSYNN